MLPRRRASTLGSFVVESRRVDGAAVASTFRFSDSHERAKNNDLC